MDMTQELSPKLGINSFIENGVRSSLIPVLTNYFQNRQMKVKWHTKYSSTRSLPGGGPQGCDLGRLEYLSQSNDSANFVPNEDKYKFVDDLSLLEIINLISIGLSSYNFKHHVASDIAINELYLPTENTKSEKYLAALEDSTNKNKMKLIFNETDNYQFSTRFTLENSVLEIVEETCLLGVKISSDLSWYRNTEYMVKRAYQRMVILNTLYSYNVPVEDLVIIYFLYIRSLVEQNSNVWTHSITQEETNDIERIQKVACRIILKDDYDGYDSALAKLNLETLETRRQSLSL